MAKPLPETTQDGKYHPQKVHLGRKLLDVGCLHHHEIEDFYMDEEQIEKTCHPVSWSNCDATTFRVRVGPDYQPGSNQKDPSKKALYTVFAVDGYKTSKKINAIFKFVDLDPHIKKWKKHEYDRKKYPLPPLVIVNGMIPNYPPEVMSSKDNGDGYQVVFYARITDEVLKVMEDYASGKLDTLPNSVRLFSEFIHAKQGSPLRQRFKCIARLMNLPFTSLNFITTRLVQQYNGKPFLARTSSTFYHELGEYFAIDIDAHLFGYPARKGLQHVRGSISTLIYDAGFVIEGHSDDELPEQILCCARICKIGVDQAHKFPNEFLDLAYTPNAMGKYSYSMPVIPRHTDSDEKKDTDKSDSHTNHTNSYTQPSNPQTQQSNQSQSDGQEQGQGQGQGQGDANSSGVSRLWNWLG